MDNNQEFLNLYKKLETYLDSKYPYSDSSIKEYIHHLEKSMIKSDQDKAAVIDFLRNLRNHFVHRDVISYVTVNNKTLDFLRKEIDLFEKPILASSIMTKIKDVYFVNKNTRMIDIFDKIYHYSYDYIPILDEKGCVKGIFSLDIILKSIYSKKMEKITEETLLSEYMDFTSIYEQNNVRFLYISKDTPREEIVELFSKKDDKKLMMIFVTSNGLKNSPLIGIITPHDVINSK